MSDKTVKNKSIRFRITAAIVLVCFITTSVSSPVSANASPAGSAVLPPVSLSELTIPDELGTIVRSVGVQDGAAADPDKTNVRDSSRRTVILIQDAHAVNDAQDKIQKIIAHLQTHHYADMLLVEGAQGRLDPTILRNYPDENAKQRVVREYLERAELAGVESAAVLNDTLGHFEGAEDWALYSENFNAYHRAQAEKESLLDILSRHERKLETENTGRINSELQDFLKRWTGFRSGSVSFLDFLISLQEFSNLAKEEDGFSELKRILDALGYEKSSQSAELEPSVKKMASEFKRKFANVMDVRDQANFYMHYQKFLTGQSGAGEMLTCLLRLGRKLGKSPKLSPEMRRLLGHTQTLTGIKGNRLFEDLNRFLGMVAMSLAKNSDDVSAIRRYEELFVLEDLVKLELTHHSLFSLMKSEARGAKFETDSRSSDLRTSDKTGVLNLDDFDLGFLSDLGLSVPDFEKKLQPALDFYRAALERDRVFYDRIKAAPESARAIVLIAGGFHTSGIERLLRENRDSYAVVTPRIGSLTGSENYLRVMNNDLSWQEYIGATYYDGLIRHAIRKLTEDLSESEFRQTAKRWRDNLIRDLASQNRITDFGQYSQYLGDLNRIYAERFAKDLKPLTKEDILGVIKRELEKFKSDVLVSLWKEVEDGPQGTTAGFSGLEERKEPSVTKPSDLAFDIPSSKPSMLSPALKLAPENLALTAPPRSEVRQQTVAARDVSEVLRRKLVLSPNAKVHEIGPGVGEPIEEGSGRIDWARKFKDVFKDKVTVFIHEPGAKRLAQTDTRLKDAKFSGKPFSAEDDSADVIIAMSVLSQPGVGDRGPVADAMARAVKVGGYLILGYYKGNPDEKARHEAYINQMQEKVKLSVVARGTDARHHWAIYRVDSKSRGAQKKGRSETRVNDVVKEKREDIRDGLRQSLRWLLAKMAVGPWRKQMLKLLLEDDRLDVKIAISSDGKDLFWIHQCFVSYDPETGDAYLTLGDSVSRLSHSSGATPTAEIDKGVELIFGDDDQLSLSVRLGQLQPGIQIFYNNQEIPLSGNAESLLVPLTKINETITFLKKTVPGFSRWQKARVKAMRRQKLEEARSWFDVARVREKMSNPFDTEQYIDRLEYGSSRFEIGISDSGEEVVVKALNRDTGILDGILFSPFLSDAWFTAGRGYANDIPVLDPDLPGMALIFRVEEDGVYVSANEDNVVSHSDPEISIPSFQKAGAGVRLPRTAKKIKDHSIIPLTEVTDTIGPPLSHNPDGRNVSFILGERTKIAQSEEGRRPGMISKVRMILIAGIVSIAMMRSAVADTMSPSGAKPSKVATSSAVAMSPKAAMSRKSFKAFQKGLQALGWYKGKVDGKDGPLTRSAVRTLQTILRDELGFSKLPVNGQYDDPATLAAIKELQGKLKVKVDGVLGPETASSLKKHLEELRKKGRETQAVTGQGVSEVLTPHFPSDPATKVLNNPTLQAGFSALGFQVIQRLLVSRQLVPNTQETRNFIYTYLYETHQIVQTAKQTLTDPQFQRVFHSKKIEMTPERVAQLAMFVFDLNNHESMGHVHIKNNRGSDFSQAQILIGTRKELFKNPLFKKIAGVTDAQPVTEKEWEEFLVTGSSANRNRIAMVIIHFLRAPRDLRFDELFSGDTVKESNMWGKYYHTQSPKGPMKAFKERADRHKDDGNRAKQYYLSQVRGKGSSPKYAVRAAAGARSELRQGDIQTAEVRPEGLRDASKYFVSEIRRLISYIGFFNTASIAALSGISFSMIRFMFQRLPDLKESIHLLSAIPLSILPEAQSGAVFLLGAVFFAGLSSILSGHFGLKVFDALLSRRISLEETERRGQMMFDEIYRESLTKDSALAKAMEKTDGVFATPVSYDVFEGGVETTVDEAGRESFKIRLSPATTISKSILRYLIVRRSIGIDFRLKTRALRQKAGNSPLFDLVSNNFWWGYYGESQTLRRWRYFPVMALLYEIPFTIGVSSFAPIFLLSILSADFLTGNQTVVKFLRSMVSVFVHGRDVDEIEFQGEPREKLVFGSLRKAFAMWSGIWGVVEGIFAGLVFFATMNLQNLSRTGWVLPVWNLLGSDWNLLDVMFICGSSLGITFMWLAYFVCYPKEKIRNEVAVERHEKRSEVRGEHGFPDSTLPEKLASDARSEIRGDEFDASDYGLMRGRLSRDSERTLGFLTEYFSRNQIAGDDANLIARTLVRMKPRSLELLRDWGVLTEKEPELITSGNMGKIMIPQDIRNSLAQRMRLLLKSYDERGYTRAQKDVLMSRLIPVDQIDAILTRSPDLTDGIVIEMLDSRFSLIFQIDRAIEVAASLRKSGVVPSLAWRILIKQGPDQALSWASAAKVVVERIKDAQEVSGQRNAWLMIMNHGIEKVEKAERRGKLSELMNAWKTRSELRQEGILKGLEKKIQETYGRVGIYGEHLSMENILLKVLEDVGRENNLALVEGEDFELFWYRERFGIIIINPAYKKTDEVKDKIIERLQFYYRKYKPKIKLTTEKRSDGVEASYWITPASLTEFGKFFGTADIQYYDQEHRFPRPFTLKEMREKLLHKAEMLQEGMRRSGLPPAEIEKFGQWASDVDFALANSDRYGQEEMIRTESIMRSRGRRDSSIGLHEDGYRYTTLNAMKENAEGSVLFDFLLRDLRRRENAKRILFLARGAECLKVTARYVNWLFSPEIVQGALENFLFMLSQDTGGKLISDIKDLFRFSPKTYLLGEEGEPDEFVESVSYDALERQAMEILEDLDRGKSRWTHVSRLYAREINPYDGDGKGLNRFTQFFDKIYDWIKEAGIVDGLQPGETILVVDESSSGTYPWILKYVIETRSLADLAKRLGKPESEIQPFRVLFQAGGRSNHDYFIEDFPIFDYGKVLGYGNFAVSAIADKGENMPHPVKFGSVGRILEEATSQVIFESEEPDVLLGAYLNSMFIYNEVVRFYNYLNGLVRKKNKTQKEWNLLLHYLTLKLPPEVEATPAALARASEFVLTERDIKMALVRKGILNELRDYAGAVYCLSDPVDLPSVLALQELMPEARIILNDSFVPGGSELVKDVPEPGDERAVRDFLLGKFRNIAKSHGFSQIQVSRGEAPGTYIVFLTKGKLSDFQRVEIEYRAGDFYQMEIPKGTGVVYLNLPERDGVSLENSGLWEKLGVGLQGPGYALVASRFDGDSFEAPGFSKLADGVEMGLFTNGVFQISRAEVRESPKSDFDRDFHRWIGNYWQELRRAYPDLPDSILKPTFYRMYKMVRDEIAPLIKEDDRILEIGVGSGVIISMLAEEVKKRGIHNVRFIGTDIDPDVARIARRMTQKYGNVEILPAGDLFNPVLGMKFDWVIWNPPWFQEQLINGQEYGPKMVDPGYGVVRRFFREVPDYLTPSGRSAVIFPSEYFPKAASEFERYYVKVAGINPKFEIGIYISDLMRGKREGWSGDPKISRASAPKEHDPKRPQRERYKREKLNKRSEVRDEGLVKAEEPAVSASMSPESVRSKMMVEAGWRKFVGRADAVRRAWNVSEKKETGGKQGVEKPFASEAVVRSDALRSGHLCLVRGNFDKLTQGLRTALDAVRDEIPVFQRWDETDSLSSELKMLTELVRNISQHVRGKEGILAIQFDKDAKRLYVAAIDRGEGFSFLTKGARTQDAKEEFGISLRADGYFEQSGINRVGAGTGMRDVVRQSERVLIRSRDTEWSEEDLRSQGQGVIPGIERKDGLPGSLVCVSVNLEESMRIINNARKIRTINEKSKNLENAVSDFSRFSDHLQWKFASKVPWTELVRVASPEEQYRPRDGVDRTYGTQENRWNYWSNQIDVRHAFLYLIGNALEQKRFLTVKEVEKYLQTAHYRLIFGVDNQSPYYPPTLLSLGFPDPEKALRAGADKLYLTKEGSVGYTQKLNDLLKCLLRPKLTIEDIIQPLFDLHRAIIVPELPRESKGAFAFPFANNSFSMNQINAVRRLLGHAGISHDRIDFELLANRKDVTRAFNYFKALMRGEAYLFDENASAPAVSGGSQTPPDVRRAEIRFEEQSRELWKNLGKRPVQELRVYVFSEDFAKSVQAIFPENDTKSLVEKILMQLSAPPELEEMAPDPKLVDTTISLMKRLLETVASRSSAERGATVGAEIDDAGVVMGLLLEALKQRPGLITEVPVSGSLTKEARKALQDLGVSVRPVRVGTKSPMVTLNDQAAVPFVLRSMREGLNDIFYPVFSDGKEIADPFMREYLDLLKIVAAIHLADIISGKKKLPDAAELKESLLQRLNIAEQPGMEMFEMSDKGLAIHSVAVEAYIKMQAETSIQKAA